MNAACERFNRTLQEEFVDYHETLLFEDLPAFNDLLFDYLLWFNAERPHFALRVQTTQQTLQLLSPVQYLSLNNNQCNLGWPDTIPFYIRVKVGSVVRLRVKKFTKAEKLFNHLKPKNQDSFGMRVQLFDAPVFLAGARSERGELMIVATNQPPKNAISVYLRRWEIENLFQSLKGRGFRFEDTHMTQPDRLAKLTGLLAIAFVWAHKIGEWKALKKPIIFKCFRDQTRRPQSSYFRYGLDHLREALFASSDYPDSLKPCCFLLSPYSHQLFL